jgi:hypothetical protein
MKINFRRFHNLKQHSVIDSISLVETPNKKLEKSVNINFKTLLTSFSRNFTELTSRRQIMESLHRQHTCAKGSQNTENSKLARYKPHNSIYDTSQLSAIIDSLIDRHNG